MNGVLKRAWGHMIGSSGDQRFFGGDSPVDLDDDWVFIESTINRVQLYTTASAAALRATVSSERASKKYRIKKFCALKQQALSYELSQLMVSD